MSTDFEQSLSAGFESVARLQPTRIALGSGDWQPTYAALNAAANRLAQRLLPYGGAGERVALLMRHDSPLIAAMLAVLKAGRVVVALNPSEPPARLEGLLGDAEPCLILTDAIHQPLARQVAGRREVLCCDDLLDGSPAPNLDRPIAADALAFLIYTSGSTGRPKAVMQTHGNIQHNVYRQTCGMGLHEADRIAFLASLSGGQGLATAWCSLLNGAALCPYPIMDQGIAGLADWLRQRRITVYASSASVFRHFLRTLGNDDRFPDVRLVRLASEPIQADDVAAFRRHFGDDCVLFHTLSSSESGNITQRRVTGNEHVPEGRLSVGWPALGMTVLLLDEQGREVTGDEIGELAVRSRYLSPGYWRQEALTAERFSGSGDQRIFRGGDLARRLADGSLVFMGRQDACVKVRGYRVEPAEIEATLLRLPGVAGAVVVAQPGPNCDAQLVAYLTGQASSAETLRRALRPILPAHMIPSGFVFLERWPLTPHGKIDREALRRISLAAEPARTDPPATETEAALANIWAEVFRRKAIGRQDHFFDLGGDSLVAMVMAAKIQARWRLEVDLRVIHDRPTLAALAEWIDDRCRTAAPASWPPLVRVPRDRPLPLSYQQERTWRFTQAPRSSGYTVARAYRLRGRFDLDVMRECLIWLCRRQEIFATTFAVIQDRPMQLVHPPFDIDIPLLDFTAAANPEQQLEAFLDEEAGRGFDLAKLPLIRMWLIRASSAEYYFARVNHHIISDNWSWWAFFREFVPMYEARLAGLPLGDPDARALQYADFAAWQRQVLPPQGEAFQQAQTWWRRYLAGRPASLTVPCQRPALQPNADDREGVFWFGLAPELSRRLNELAQQEGATFYGSRLAGVAALLALESGQTDAVLGTYFANRTQLELQGMFGYFANLITLRLRCQAQQTFRQWLNAVRKVVNEAQARGFAPYEQLGEALGQHGLSLPEIKTIFAISDKRTIRFGDAELIWHNVRSRRMPWGFAWIFDQQQEQGECRVTFDTVRYDPARVRELIERLKRFLAAVVLQPDRPMGELCNSSVLPARAAA